MDEVGELPLAAQVRLLRILQDGWMERVGGHEPVHVDVRIVAATHRDLAAMVAEGQFREDLWYRIAVFPIRLPPLRERPEDIPAMARHFAERAAVRFVLPEAPLTAEDIRLLTAYPWPGNVRELGAVIDRAAILGNGKRLEVAQALGASERPPADSADSAAATGSAGSVGDTVARCGDEEAHRERSGRYARPHRRPPRHRRAAEDQPAHLAGTDAKAGNRLGQVPESKRRPDK